MIEMYELRDAAPTLLSLAIIEVLLSMDRLLEVSESAEHLPAEQRRTAVRVGGILADVARFGGLVGAGLLFSSIWTKILGAAYLLYLMSSHFAPKKNEGAAPVTTHWSMGTSILQVGLLDLQGGLRPERVATERPGAAHRHNRGGEASERRMR